MKNFIIFIGIKQNQRSKTLEYFSHLHKSEPILEQFENGSFRIFATLLFSGVYKKSNCWVVRVYVQEALSQYAYPFMLSKSFRNYNNKTDCLLKLTLIQAISVKTTKKVFHLSQFLEQLKFSGNQIVNIKQDLIFLIQEVVQQTIIRSKLKLVYKMVILNIWIKIN